jgi:uncharacterized protein YjbK
MLTNLLFSTNLFAGNVDVAELQWSLCESPESVISKLDLPEAHKKTLSQSYLDTDDLKLLKSKVFIRIRNNGESFKSTVKLNFANENTIPADILNNEQADCEYDTYISLDKVGCSIKNKTNDESSVLSKIQKHFFEKFAPNIPITSLVEFGPFVYEKWETNLSKNQIITFDNLVSRDGKSYYEISVRVDKDQRHEQFNNLNNYFISKGVQVCAQHVDRTSIVVKSH